MSDPKQIDPNEIRWYVMRAYRKENLAEARLQEIGTVEYYLPKHTILQMNHGRRICRQVPVIPSIIFIHACRNDILQLKRQYNFLQFSVWKTKEGCKFLTVPEKEMNDFIRISSAREAQVRFYRPGEIDLKKGTRVRLIGGTFDGAEGIYLRAVGRRGAQFIVEIPDMLAASVSVSPELIQII